MKKQYFLNSNIIDTHNSINEVGGLIIDESGFGNNLSHAPFVGNGPGAIAFVRMPYFTHSAAIDLVNAKTPPFAAAEGAT